MYLAYNFTTVTEILVDHLKRIVNTKNRKILLTEIVIFTYRRRHNKKNSYFLLEIIMTNIKHCLKIIILQSETMKVMKTETEKHFKKIKTFNNSLIMKLISFLKILMIILRMLTLLFLYAIRNCSDYITTLNTELVRISLLHKNIYKTYSFRSFLLRT